VKCFLRGSGSASCARVARFGAKPGAGLATLPPMPRGWVTVRELATTTGANEHRRSPATRLNNDALGDCK
jgi:hypothetical protein